MFEDRAIGGELRVFVGVVGVELDEEIEEARQGFGGERANKDPSSGFSVHDVDFALSDPFQNPGCGFLGRHGLGVFIEPGGVHHGCADPGEVDAGAGDVLVEELGVEGVVEVCERGLGGSVGAKSRAGQGDAGGEDIDDVAVAALSHAGEEAADEADG